MVWHDLEGGIVLYSLSLIVHTMHMHLPRYTGKAWIRPYPNACLMLWKAFNKRLLILKVYLASTSGDPNNLDILFLFWITYSMTGIKGPTLFFSSLSDCIVFKFDMHKENSLN